MDISSYLASALNEDDGTRNLAVAELRRLQTKNSSDFMLSLAREMSNKERVAMTRQLSGILLKNCLLAREECKDEHWAEIKEILVRTLNSSTREVWHIAAQVIAKIVRIESKENWLELFKQLQHNLIQSDSSSSLKQASLETLGYVCEKLSPDELEATESGDIMRAITRCMKGADTRNTSEIRLAATRAFNNALTFVKFKFEDMDSWRNSIIDSFRESASAGELETRVKAFESLVPMASYSGLHNYDVMLSLIKPTCDAFEEDQEPVALLAMEFWISVYEQEVSQPKLREGQRYVLTDLAYSLFGSKLLATLLRHAGEWDDDSWTIPKAAQEFLSLLVSITFDELMGTSKVLELIVPFVDKHSRRPDADSRQYMAAALAIGAVIDSFEPFTPQKCSYLYKSGLHADLLAVHFCCDEDDQVIQKVTAEYMERVPDDGYWLWPSYKH